MQTYTLTEQELIVLLELSEEFIKLYPAHQKYPSEKVKDQLVRDIRARVTRR